jgi:hypothetical protein
LVVPGHLPCTHLQIYVTVLGQYEFNVATFQQAMLSLLNGNVGDVTSKMMFLGLARDVSYTNGLMKVEAWVLATIILKIMLGTLYVSYFFSVVLYPYARFKVGPLTVDAASQAAAPFLYFKRGLPPLVPLASTRTFKQMCAHEREVAHVDVKTNALCMSLTRLRQLPTRIMKLPQLHCRFAGMLLGTTALITARRHNVICVC